MADSVEDNQSSNFPQSPSAFDADDRVSFSRIDNKFILESEEGNEYEWDSALKRWIPVVDQELLDQQGEIYRVAGVDENEPVENKKKKKRKQEGDESGQKPKKPRVNTAVYVTSVPFDATQDEIKDVFSKCGVIAEEIDSRNPRIKMYEDEQGQFKGDALVVYFRAESVNLAVQLLDDTDFRFGTEGPMGKMKVQAADFSYKVQKDVPPKGNKNDQMKVIKKTKKMNDKLADWDDDDPSVLPDTSSRWDKVVILKHMFTLQELEEDPAAILDIKEDIRDECAKLGEVTNVVLFDKEDAGVASIRFANATSAEACVRLMNGRWFEGRQVVAHIANGNEKFKKSGDKKVTFDSDDDEADKRLDKFGAWLEEDG